MSMYSMRSTRDEQIQRSPPRGNHDLAHASTSRPAAPVSRERQLLRAVPRAFSCVGNVKIVSMLVGDGLLRQEEHPRLLTNVAAWSKRLASTDGDRVASPVPGQAAQADKVIAGVEFGEVHFRGEVRCALIYLGVAGGRQ
jgi:hypothetical protein